MSAISKLSLTAALLAGFAAFSTLGGAAEKPMNASSGEAVATFAGGCFWCVESGFEKLPGVRDAVSGYSGGNVENPTYHQVSAGGTGHTESVQVFYDPKVITYEGLLKGFWRLINPTDGDGQFVDRGSQYRPAIFYHNAEQKAAAERSRDELAASGRFDKPIAVEIVPFERFYNAEDYHQDYYKKNPIRYKFYTFNSGRYQYVESKWGDDIEVDYSQYKPIGDAMKDDAMTGTYVRPSDSEIKAKLTPLQYDVTQHEGTEPSFRNAYWDNKKPGIYVDIVTGEPLFSSVDKFKSGTGWPSFTKPIDPDALVEKTDRSLFHDPHRGPQQDRRFPSRPCLRRRAGADRVALLHQLGGPAFHSGRGSGRGRLWPIRRSVRRQDERRDEVDFANQGPAGDAFRPGHRFA